MRVVSLLDPAVLGDPAVWPAGLRAGELDAEHGHVLVLMDRADGGHYGPGLALPVRFQQLVTGVPLYRLLSAMPLVTLLR